MNASTVFHGSLDASLTKYLDNWEKSVETITGERHIVTQTRTVRYRFYSHFHPYVRELGKRLIEKSVSGLQAADTEYVQNTDGTFLTLPFSFRLALPAGLALNLPKPGEPGKFEAITLPDVITVTLPETVKIKLADGNEATLPGNVIAQGTDRGTRVVQTDGKTADLPLETVVSLADVLTVTLPEAVIITGEDGMLRRLTESAIVDVPAGTNVQLLGGKPQPTLFRDFFKDRYGPTDLVQRPYPVRDLDFSSSGAYAVYNWELFYHIPLAIAVNLSKNQRYEEAQRWFHFIFDPTDSSDGPTPERFWKVKPFQFTEVRQIEDILINLSSGADSQLKQDTVNSIGAWKDAPFRPHLVARYRQTAYMFKAVMAYLDNLIAWGDDLFRQDTGEAINEATQIYVLASLLLGERPQAVPQKGTIAPLTYASKRGKWDEFDNTLEKIESEIPFDLTPFPTSGGADAQFATLRSISTALYFCVPRNDKLMSYWDTVADRLFKIRNSLNLQGIFRQLPLFEPPIDPALLARATAAGLDVGTVIAGINQPLSLVRFQLLAQKAGEICQEVKSLGNNLLSAIEKEDNEALAILRARHEKAILDLTETVKYAQWQETIKNREGLETSLANAVQRYVYYERQLGKQESDITIPELEGLDAESLAKFKFKAAEPGLERRPVAIDIAQDLGSSGGKMVSSHEAEELEKSGLARDIQDVIKALNLAAQGTSLIPDFGIKLHFWGLGGDMTLGGTKISAMSKYAAEVALAYADRLSYEAGRAAKIGSYARREQEWAFQSGTIAGEINQIFKQLRAAQIRESIAEREWRNHQKQMQHAAEIEDFLTNEKVGKKTNQAFYAWLKREVRGIYGTVFQFAYEVAKKAERALQHELGKPDLTFLQYGYMAGKEGLLAGEKLYLDIKRMEMAYLELNQREYELTKNVSLLQIDPTALLQLRTTGRCTISLPEELFDMDGPGHYFRRIKTVALSIPCVIGPYASVNCTLTLLKSSIRRSALLRDGNYARENAEDERFSDYFGSMQSIVTSTAQNDSGLFETNLRDERYLPFENAGAVSEWQLALPADPSRNDPAQFDYDTISDVILHLKYTAREAGDQLRNKALANLKSRIDDSTAAGTVRLFSVRHEFPTEWAKARGTLNSGATVAELKLTFQPQHYPFWSQAHLQSVKRIDAYAKVGSGVNGVDLFGKLSLDGQPDNNAKYPLAAKQGNLRFGVIDPAALPTPTSELKLYLTQKTIDDLLLLVSWGK
ncbi:insecticidal toxin protein [Larkinella terrae]|nr:insecticidal toxin protein [Larkinella terrae]